MALDNDWNRVLASLRDRLEGVDSSALATWKRHRDGSGQAVITDRGRDHLVRQGL